MNGNGLRQKNGTVTEQQPPPNAWRILDRKANPDDKTNTPTLSQLLANNTNSSPSGEAAELVNLAHKVNIAERLKRQKEKEKDKEKEAKIPTEEDVLKKMLGVGLNKPAKIDSNTVQFPNNTQKVDLNTLFGKANLNEFNSALPSLSDLPKPPLAWHMGSQSNQEQQQPPDFFPTRIPPNQQQMQFPLYQQQQQQHHHQQQPQPLLQPQFPNNAPMNMMDHYFGPYHPNMPLPLAQYPMMQFNTPPQQQYFPQQMYQRPPDMPYFGNQNYPMPMMPQGPHCMLPQAPPPFMNASQQIRMSMPYYDGPANRGPPPATHKSPEGPQKLKTRTGSASAFIPLQAARKVVKGKSSAAITQSSNDSTNNDRNAEQTPQIVQVEVRFARYIWVSCEIFVR